MAAQPWAWQPASAFHVQVTELQQRASDCEALASTVKTATFERKLGAVILLKQQQGKTLDALAREWDKNSDGDISAIEFRASVRNSLGLPADNKEIDAYFVRRSGDAEITCLSQCAVLVLFVCAPPLSPWTALPASERQRPLSDP